MFFFFFYLHLLSALFCSKPAIQIFLKPGHKIGRPAPLFAKIEQQRLDELKKKYSGSQFGSKEASPQLAPPSTVVLKTVQEAEIAVAVQGDEVRKLKASGAEKADVQAQVKILLDLKKQLASLQLNSQTNGEVKHNSVASSAAPAADNASKIQEVEGKIVEQGEKVRKLKASGDKTVWQPEVEKLLALKKELVTLGRTPAAPTAAATSGKSKSKK